MHRFFFKQLDIFDTSFGEALIKAITPLFGPMFFNASLGKIYKIL
ncbi:hypothetical protein pah_c050o049 [Parachlamydia acanthamoebae str. Hall's coccus]|nr:hypothetical protein pah_c050o049 [Parachlamydia acanthamoebae str. Hall's coccus]